MSLKWEELLPKRTEARRQGARSIIASPDAGRVLTKLAAAPALTQPQQAPVDRKWAGTALTSFAQQHHPIGAATGSNQPEAGLTRRER